MKTAFLFLLLLSSLTASAQTGALMSALIGATLPCFNLNTNWAPKQSNMKALWNFDGTVGAIANNATFTSGNGGPTATAVVGTSLSYISAMSTKYSQALSLSGNSGDYVNIGTPAVLNDLQSTGMTVSMWIKIPAFTASSSDAKFILNKSQNTSYGWLLLYDNNMIYFQAVSSGNMKKQTNNVAAIAGTWAHLVLTWDGTLVATGTHIYINGKEVTSYNYTQDGSGTQTTDAAEPLTLGKAGAVTGYTTKSNSDASIDDLVIWNTPFSAGEVSSLYLNQTCN